MTTFSPIFLKPSILRALSARKIEGFRKIGEGSDMNKAKKVAASSAHHNLK